MFKVWKLSRLLLDNLGFQERTSVVIAHRLSTIVRRSHSAIPWWPYTRLQCFNPIFMFTATRSFLSSKAVFLKKVQKPQGHPNLSSLNRIPQEPTKNFLPKKGITLTLPARPMRPNKTKPLNALVFNTTQRSPIALGPLQQHTSIHRRSFHTSPVHHVIPALLALRAPPQWASAELSVGRRFREQLRWRVFQATRVLVPPTSLHTHWPFPPPTFSKSTLRDVFAKCNRNRRSGIGTPKGCCQ